MSQCSKINILTDTLIENSSVLGKKETKLNLIIMNYTNNFF